MNQFLLLAASGPSLVNGSAIKKSGGCGSVHPGVPGQSAYLNAAAFADPAPFTLGNVSVLSTARACGSLDEDLGIDKEIPIRESKRIAIGALAYNLFNRHQLININSNIDSPAFGTFSGASFPRSIQLYVRIEF